MTEIVIGVVAGVLTSALMTLLKAFWVNSIGPFIAKLRYQGVQVDGAWGGTFNDPVKQVYTDTRLLLEQNAHVLRGTFTYTFRSLLKSFTLDFNVTGYIWEGYLTLNCLPKDRRVTSYAIALLKIQGGGLSLIGQYCFRNVEIDTVTAIPIILNRSDTPLGGLANLRPLPPAAPQPEPPGITATPLIPSAPHANVPQISDTAPVPGVGIHATDPGEESVRATPTAGDPVAPAAQPQGAPTAPS